MFPDEVHSFLVHDRWLRTFEAQDDFLDRVLLRGEGVRWRAKGADDVTLDILYSLGASLVDLVTVLFDVFDVTLEKATALLLGFGFTLVDIIAAWPG